MLSDSSPKNKIDELVPLSFNLSVLGPSSDWILRSIKSSLLSHPNLSSSSSSDHPIYLFTHYTIFPKSFLFKFSSATTALLFTHRDPNKYYPNFLYTLSLFYYDYIFVMNSRQLSLLQTLFSRYSFLPQPRLFLNYFAGVDSSFLSYVSPPKSYFPSLPKGFFVIGFHCRLYPRKRAQFLVSAMAKLTNCVLLCCGPGHQESEVYRPLVNSNRVFFVDPDLSDLREFYNKVDLLVCTSSVEGGPTPLMEANAAGVPFLSTDVGFARDIASPYDSIIPIDSTPEQIAQAIALQLGVEHSKPHYVHTWQSCSASFYNDLHLSIANKIKSAHTPR